MPNISQSEIRKKEFYVVRDSTTGNVIKLIFPNNLQIGVVGTNEEPNSVFYGKIGIGVSNPTALLHFEAGTTAQGTSPIKFTSGSLLATPEPGAIEYDGTDIFYTIDTDSQVRRNITAKPYASYFSTQNQTNSPVTNESIFTFNNTAYESYFTLGSSTKIYAQYTAYYNVAFSVQFNNNDSSDQIGRVWLKKDGVNVSSTRSDVTVPKAQGGTDGQSILAVNFFIMIESGHYIELAWSATNTKLTAETLPAGTSPTTPASPSIVVTLNRVD